MIVFVVKVTILTQNFINFEGAFQLAQKLQPSLPSLTTKAKGEQFWARLVPEFSPIHFLLNYFRRLNKLKKHFHLCEDYISMERCLVLTVFGDVDGSLSERRRGGEEGQREEEEE